MRPAATASSNGCASDSRLTNVSRAVAASLAELRKKLKQATDKLAVETTETLATRKQYAQALLAAVKNKKIPRDDIPVHVARSLKYILGNRFVQVYGEVKSIGADREQQMAKYKKLVTPSALAKADASRGRAVQAARAGAA